MAPNLYAMVKYRIEPRREVEERVQQVVVPLPVLRQALAAVMLKGADPVGICRQRIELERQPLDCAPRADVENALDVPGLDGVPTIARQLERHSRSKRHNRRSSEEPVSALHLGLHLKSRREKTKVAASTSAAM